MKRPLVTIMVPVHNGERTIARAVESALAQPYEPLEVVVADDMSSDGTQAVVQRLASDARLRYVRRNARLGRVANYHQTLYVDARGTYVMNLDGDDWLLPTSFISDAVARLEEDPLRVLAIGLQRTFLEREQREYVEPRPYPLAGVVPGEAIFFGFADGLRIPHLAALYRRHDACATGFYSRDLLWSDAESMLRLVLGRRVVALNHVVGVWRIHDANASHDLDAGRHRFEIFELVDAVHAAGVQAGLPSHRLRAWRVRLKTDAAYAFLMGCLKRGDPLAALRYLVQLGTHAPGIVPRLLLDPRRPFGTLLRLRKAVTR